MAHFYIQILTFQPPPRVEVTERPPVEDRRNIGEFPYKRGETPIFNFDDGDEAFVQVIFKGPFRLLQFCCDQCDQIWRFFGLWATFESLWQQLICPNLPSFLSNFCKGVKIYHFSS